MFCRNCGAKINDDASFCKACGKPIVRSKPQPTPEPAPAPAPQPKPVQTQPVQPTPQPAPQPRPVQPTPQPRPVQQTAAPKKKSNVGLIVALSIVGVLVVAGLIIGTVFAFNNFSSKKKTHKKDDDQIEQPVEPTDGDVRTLMIYMVGSNLESGDTWAKGGAASRDLDEILAANIPENCNVVIECGGAKKWENKDVPDGEVTIFSVENGKLKQQKSLGKHTMTETGDLADFITYSKENFPAESYTLILWDHGGGIPVGFGMDELGDEDNMMTDYEIRDELNTAGVDFDAVIFDACNMCTLEMGMSLKDHAKYMVGAESYVNNAGIYYTNWLELLDGDASAFSEKIVQDYMSTINDDGLVGSMSVIRLDYIQDVYDAYVAYIGDVSDDIDAGKYGDYVKARSSCGAFDDIDSVDLIALATAYDTDGAADLINKAVNAVEYTDSDFAYGHGIMVYSPYEWYQVYTQGREAFIELEYDNTVTDFYDKFVSMELAYMGSQYVSEYGGDWYNSAYTQGISASSAYDLPTVNTGDYYAVELTAEDWDKVDYITQTLVIESDGEYIILGEDYQYEKDSEGRLALVNPQNWTFVNDTIAAFYCVSYYNDPNSDEWYQLGAIPVTINGYSAMLYVYYDNEHPNGTVQGYTSYDFDTHEEGSYLYDLYNSDEIDLCYQIFDDSGNASYSNYGEPFLASELELGYYGIDLDSYTTYGYYTVYDIYGNTYSTDLEQLGSRSDLQ